MDFNSVMPLARTLGRTWTSSLSAMKGYGFVAPRPVVSGDSIKAI